MLELQDAWFFALHSDESCKFIMEHLLQNTRLPVYFFYWQRQPGALWLASRPQSRMLARVACSNGCIASKMQESQ